MADLPPPDPAVFDIIFDEARNGRAHQAGAIDELRRRAGVLLGAASIAASFLGGIALDDSMIGEWGKAAIVAFALIGLLCLWVLWPIGWKFVLSADVLIDGWAEGTPPAGAAEMRRDLARVIERNRLDNQRKLNRLWTAYQVGILLVVGMIGTWLFELINLRIEFGALPDRRHALTQPFRSRG